MSERGRAATLEAAVNIREVIEKLQEVATNLPNGFDTEVEIQIYNGHDSPGLRTTSVEVNAVWMIDEEMRTTREAVAQIQGHPYRDAGSGETMPMTAQIDDLVEKWATEEQETGEQSASRDMIRVTTDDEEYVLLPWPEGRYVKLPYVAGAPLLPGAPNATEAGCTCSPERNNYGRGYRRGDHGVEMAVEDDCPVHLKVEGPGDLDQQAKD
ncbi:MAG: hypothetical protein M3319_15530 [Actinomycetota bacterium]|nr:hypothetical protein [Actinomycetota bacterium]